MNQGSKKRGGIREDLSVAPARRLSLLDFTGQFPAEVQEFLRAHFERQEERDSKNTMVFLLTYWGIEDGSYQRAWIDAKTHLLVRREIYRRGGKLQVIYRYLQPVEVKPDLWTASLIEIRGANDEIAATISVTNVQSDLDVSDSLFTVSMR